MKIVINCNTKLKKNQKKINLITDPNMKSEYTQTEEIFFKMHWSYFSGQYKIIDCGPRLITTNRNYFGISTNLFGQIRTRSEFYKNNTGKNYQTLISIKNISN